MILKLITFKLYLGMDAHFASHGFLNTFPFITKRLDIAYRDAFEAAIQSLKKGTIDL